MGLALGSALKEIQTETLGLRKNISEEPNMLTHTYTHAHKNTHAHTPHPHATQQAHTTYLHAHACKHARQACAQSKSTHSTHVSTRACTGNSVSLCTYAQAPCTSGPLKTGRSSRPRTLCLCAVGCECCHAMGSTVSSWPFTFGRSCWYFRGLHFQRNLRVYTKFPQSHFLHS